MRGTIAVITERRIDVDVVEQLLVWAGDAKIVMPRGDQIARQRNEAVEQMEGSWLAFIDADMVLPAGALDTLVQARSDITAAVMLERREPFDVCATKTFEPTVRWTLKELMTLRRVRRVALQPVLAVGLGCTVIRRDVFEAMRAPWFRVGEFVVDAIAEDAEFSIRAAEAGFTSHLALNVLVGHRAEATLWPLNDEIGVQWDGEPGCEPLDAIPSPVCRYQHGAFACA